MVDRSLANPTTIGSTERIGLDEDQRRRPDPNLHAGSSVGGGGLPGRRDGRLPKAG